MMTKQEAATKLQEAIEVALCTGWTTIRIRVEDAMQICNLLCEEEKDAQN